MYYICLFNLHDYHVSPKLDINQNILISDILIAKQRNSIGIQAKHIVYIHSLANFILSNIKCPDTKKSLQFMAFEVVKGAKITFI